MSNKCEIDVVDFIFNNHESIRKLNELIVDEKEVKDIELLDFVNKETMFAVISPNNRLFGKYNRIEKTFDFNGRTVNFYIAFAGTSCQCLAVIDKNIEKDTIIPVYYDSLKALMSSSGNIELSINHEKVLKLKV